MNLVPQEVATSTPPPNFDISGNQYFLTPESSMPFSNHPRLSPVQLEALTLLLRGHVQLTNQGRYALVENGETNEELTLRKPVLRALADKGLVEFKDRRGQLVYEITEAGREAARPESPWQRPLQPPGRTPRVRPEPSNRPKGAATKGSLVHFVMHPRAKGKAFATLREANACARGIQAGYAAKKAEIPVIEIETRRYVAFGQKLLVRILNKELSPDDVTETWRTKVQAHTNMKTYSRYKVIE